MKNKTVRILICALVIGAVAALTACATKSISAESGKIIVKGFEWGPGVTGVVVELPSEATAVSADNAVVKTNGTERSITSVALSNEEGIPQLGAASSKYVVFELETSSTVGNDIFVTGEGVVGLNAFAKKYPFEATFNATVEGKNVKYHLSADAGNKENMISPDTDLFTVSGEHSGSYKNPLTSDKEDLKLMYKAYEPETLKSDNARNPLIIWLHGAGEGGEDPDICILGNEVSALAKDPIQSYFTTDGGEGGAYVLVVQSPTMWMDAGDSSQGSGDKASRYTEILKDTITKYLDENTDVDRDRVYVGGCSNGGFMTMNMLIEYPELFAAAYPNCEAYAFNEYEKESDGNYKYDKDKELIPSETRFVTDAKIERIKDKPIWFVHSADDWVVEPENFSLPTYRALLKAGAKNVWFSYYENVVGTDDPNANQNIILSPEYTVGPGYMGHFSWIYTFNDQVTGVQDPAAIAASTDTETFGFLPTNNGGGNEKAQGTYDNLFKWMNAQHK